jgi:peptide chain release factor 2
MAKAGFWDDRADAQALLGELKRTKAAIEPVADLRNRLDDIKALGELTQEEETEESVEELNGEIASFSADLEGVESRAMLSGEDDHRNAFLSIHAGAGGTESCDWAEMLYRMYTRWMENNKYECEVVDLLQGEEAGIKRITMRVEGVFSYGYLKAEMGVHRLVRISPFDSNKRRHTSFA